MTERESVMRVAVRAFGPFEDAIRAQWSLFAAATGSALVLDAVPLELHDLWDALVPSEGLANGTWDIAFLSTDWLAEIAERQCVVDLAPRMGVDPPAGFPDAWPRSLLEHQHLGETILGLPYHDGPECLIYRTDLFGDPREQAAYRSQFGVPLAPPRDWHEYTRIAEFFQRPEQGLYGTTFAAFPDGHNTVFDYCLQLWSRGGELWDAHQRIRFDSDQSIAALEYYRSIVTNERAVHPRSAAFDSVAAGKAIADGEVAMAINWFGFAAVAADHPSSRVRGKIDIALIPTETGTGLSLNSYWILGIASGSHHIETAYQFLKFCSSPEMDLLLTNLGGIGCRRSTWADPTLNHVIPFYHRLEPLHLVARTLPRRADWSRIARTIDKMMLEIIGSNEPVRSIAQRYSERWEQQESK